MSPTPEDLAAQFTDLDAASASSGTLSRTIRLADRAVRFEAADATDLDLLCGAMRHLPTADADADLSVRIVRRRALAGAVTWRWAWEVPNYETGRFAFVVMSWMGLLIATDLAAGRTIVVVDDEVMGRLERPETTRPVLESLLSRTGLVSVHGGTVGDGERCVLLTGSGGSGKSSLVAEAVARGHRTVGDDFLYLRPGPDPLLYSAYGTVKLAPSSPASRLLDQAIPLVDGKRLGWLPDLRPGSVVGSQRPVAIVLPRVGDRVSLEPADDRAVLTALLPSSVAMSTDRAVSTRELAAFARSLPCFTLTVADDPDAALAAVGELAGLGRGVPA